MLQWLGDTTRVLTIIYYVFVLLVGLTGNILVLLVILKRKHMRNSTSIFLLNLAVVDMIMIIFTAPTRLLKFIKNDRIVLFPGIELCLTFEFLWRTMINASVLTILSLTFERYYAICQPLKASYICTNKRAAIICVLVWVFAALFATPVLATFSIQYQSHVTIELCLPVFGFFWNDLYFLVATTVFFFIPLVILTVLYSLIAKNLITNSRMIDENTRNSRSYVNAMRFRKRVLIVLGVDVLIFFSCFLPLELLRVLKILVPDLTKNYLGVHGNARFVHSTDIGLVSLSTMNPILYNLVSSEFREELAILLGIDKLIRFCKKSKEKTQKPVILSTHL